MSMFTIRNVGGVSLFLFGTTFLWLTRMFASRGVDTTGTAWAVTDALSYVSIAGFTAATWGLFQRTSWWETVAVAAALVGAAALVPYGFAAQHAGETAPAFNILIHALGSAGVIVLLLVPTLQQWVDKQVMS
jgi:hypothetical protein